MPGLSSYLLDTFSTEKVPKNVVFEMNFFKFHRVVAAANSGAVLSQLIEEAL